MSENRYDRLPEVMQPHARAYVEDHQPVGGFLFAVLSNNLVDAFGKADPDNRAAMREWCLWLWNDIPAKCWGSPEKVDAWLHPEEPEHLCSQPGGHWDANGSGDWHCIHEGCACLPATV